MARCSLTKKVLTARGIEFVEVDIRESEAARTYVVEDLSYTEAPVVVVTDEDHWSGFAPTTSTASQNDSPDFATETPPAVPAGSSRARSS